MKTNLEFAFFAQELIEEWKRPTGKTDQYDVFEKLNKAEVIKLIGFIVDETDDIKLINKLLRIQESAAVIADCKLLYETIKSSVTEC